MFISVVDLFLIYRLNGILFDNGNKPYCFSKLHKFEFITKHGEKIKFVYIFFFHISNSIMMQVIIQWL
ncbi:MAG: hypothetical protein H6Q14_425 [Bacteroidetes bacterium]|jgi:hypothetical protein|nr:hypothetical protein [Bacteroidota bacterium]